MSDFKARLRKAIGEGVALAALGAAACGPVIPSISFSADGGIRPPVVADAGPVGTPNPYPVAQLRCHGPEHTSGYHGFCCNQVSCYTPANGICALTAPAEIGLPPGSGTCSCSVEEGTFKPTEGPYDPNPAHTPNKTGSCCYLFGSIQCDGRPLIVDGAAVTAPVQHREDWG